MPGHWKLRKKWNSHKEISHKSRNSKEVISNSGLSKRRKTISAGEASAARRSKSNSALHKTVESPEHSYTTGRHYMRRPALLMGSDRNIHSLSVSSESPSFMSLNFITISLDDGNLSFKKTVSVKEGRTMEELLQLVFRKQGLTEDVFADYHFTSCRGGTYSQVDLEAPAMDYLASVIEIQPLKNIIQRSNRPFSLLTDGGSVQSCLDYFETNGLVEIPSSSQADEEDSFHLPRVTPLDPIESSLEELDIDDCLIKSMSNKELAQQQAIWELIATEHSFLRQLETVINLFMRALELIRRTGQLTEVNYHNVFGYMEEIYQSHEQFWTWTLQPCLEKSRQAHCPLDLGVIILRYPVEIATDFDIYEQHCAFERTNLRSLDEAMTQKDFMTYLGWCEAQPQCERLKLKDFLAKPMQRLTKYTLLFKAILSRTTNESHIKELEQMIEDMSTFVTSVNGVLKAQEETQRVEEVMKKIVGYNPVELASEFKELVQPYVKLDLLAPMPDVDITRPRILIVEGKLRYKDSHTKMMVAHVFLFSDMLLITKTKGNDRFVVIRPPFKISQLQVHHKETGTITCIVLNDYRVLVDVFTLKAHSADIAQEWADQIAAAQEFYSSAMERKSQSWRLLECLQQERTLHGISQDFLHEPHWSTQSVSGSPVPSQSGEFRRVPSCESTLSTSSSVFPTETSTVQERRHSSMSKRSSSVDQAQLERLSLNLPSSPPPLPENHRVSFPFCSPSSSPSIQRPVWQRARSLNTLTVHSGDLLLDLKQKRKRSSFQITLKDATTQTDSSEMPPNLHLSIDNDTDSTTDDEFSPVLRSPTTPINIIISSTNGSVYTHHRSKSDCFPSLQRQSAVEKADSFLSHDSHMQNGFSSSPTSPVSVNKESVSRPSSLLLSDSLGSDSCSYPNELQSEDSANYLSTTLPSNFRLPSSDSRFKLQRHSAVQLSKIYESTDEDSDENSDDNQIFSRGSNLRRSKSSFELSYGSKSLLKPPSPLITTHMHRNGKKLHDLISYNGSDRLSPILDRKTMFMGSSLEDDDEEEEQGKIGKIQLQKDDAETNHNEDGTIKKSGLALWGIKRVKSAGTNKNKGRSLFGLFSRNRAVSMENIVDRTTSKPFPTSTAKQKSPSRSNQPRSPLKSPKISQSNKQHNENITMSSNLNTHPIVASTASCTSSSEESSGEYQQRQSNANPPKTLRKSLQLIQPDHKVVFLSPSSLPSSPDVSVKHRIMKVFPNEL